MNTKHSRNRRIVNSFRTLFKKKQPEAIHSFSIDVNDPVVLELGKVPKTRKEVAGEYNVSVKVLNGWFLEKNLNIPSRLICPGDLKLIYVTLGPPGVKKPMNDSLK